MLVWFIINKDLKIQTQKYKKWVTAVIFVIVVALITLELTFGIGRSAFAIKVIGQGEVMTAIAHRVRRSCLSNNEVQEINNVSKVQQDILVGAKERTSHSVLYISKYYSDNEGKPPDHEGVCTDLFWRALEPAQIDIQELIYQDMKKNEQEYPLSLWGMDAPDRGIDFRRVPNIEVYLKRYAKSLTLEVNECDFDNLKEWQPGDIVIFKLDRKGPSDHIAIVSDKRESNGVPYLIHNYGVGEVERAGLTRFGEIVGHYRISGI